MSLLGAAWSPVAPAQSIDLSLNLFYTDPLSDLSGGTWQLAAKSADSSGIAGLGVYMTGIDTPPSQPVGPRGTVNGVDPAGFGEFDPFTNGLPDGVDGLIIGQRAIQQADLEAGEEQSVFYGVGTLQNGQPGDIGPVFTSLTDTQAIPWATGDTFFEAEWDTAAILATGLFSPGQIPAFFEDSPFVISGSVFDAVGSSTVVGTQSLVGEVMTIVRDNLGGSPDYNVNGVVDAADYTIWRDMLGQTGPGLAADGSGNGVVDQADYDFWKLHFGLVIPGPGAASQGGGSDLELTGQVLLGPGAVPEPATGTLLAGALGILFLRQRIRLLRSAKILRKKRFSV